jgi:hypothetical protein
MEWFVVVSFAALIVAMVLVAREAASHDHK